MSNRRSGSGSRRDGLSARFSPYRSSCCIHNLSKNMTRVSYIICAIMAVFMLSSCQQGILGGYSGSPAVRDSSDSVTRLSQVDPYYRGAFVSQHGSNFSLADQRKAFFAARRTANTPVPKSMPRGKIASSKKYSSRKYSSKRKTASRKKYTSRKRVASSRKSASRKRVASRRRR